MFTDKVEVKDFEKTDPEYQDLLRRVLAIQADCEIGGPNLHNYERFRHMAIKSQGVSRNWSAP